MKRVSRLSVLEVQLEVSVMHTGWDALVRGILGDFPDKQVSLVGDP